MAGAVAEPRDGPIDYDELVRDDRVHGRVYRDPRIFEEELERIFHRGWVYVAHESQLPEPGDFVMSAIGRHPVICSRDEQGVVHVLLNRCAHRANTVCQEDAGSTSKFRCDYHGWTYRLDGRLSSVPHRGAYEGRSPAHAGPGLMRAARVGSYRGFVFASLHEDVASLDEHLGAPTKEQIDLFVDLSPEGEVQLSAGALKYWYRGNWKLTLENALDGYHPQFVHETWFDTIVRNNGLEKQSFGGDQAGQYTRDLGNGHGLLDLREYKRQVRVARGRAFPVDVDPFVAAARPGTPELRESSRPDVFPNLTAEEEKQYVAAMIARHGRDRAREIMTCEGTHLAVFPNLFLVAGAVRVLRPISVEETQIIASPVLLKGAPQEINTMRLRGFENFFGAGGVGHPDDVEMWERTTDGLRGEASPWLDLSRGTHRERTDRDGTVVAEMTDELPVRAMFRHWRELMKAT